MCVVQVHLYLHPSTPRTTTSTNVRVDWCLKGRLALSVVTNYETDTHCEYSKVIWLWNANNRNEHAGKVRVGVTFLMARYLTRFNHTMLRALSSLCRRRSSLASATALLSLLSDYRISLSQRSTKFVIFDISDPSTPPQTPLSYAKLHGSTVGYEVVPTNEQADNDRVRVIML